MVERKDVSHKGNHMNKVIKAKNNPVFLHYKQFSTPDSVSLTEARLPGLES